MSRELSIHRFAVGSLGCFADGFLFIGTKGSIGGTGLTRLLALRQGTGSP
jgi:hypothetical protein